MTRKTLYLWSYAAKVRHIHGPTSGTQDRAGDLVTPLRDIADVSNELKGLLHPGGAPSAAYIEINTLTYRGALLASGLLFEEQTP